jgi:glycosyltransferase involved in cell wall biosynthesis
MHHGERWLAETLNSVVAQNDPGIECLAIDSSADEGTSAILRAYADRLNIRFFKRPDLDNWRSKTNFAFAAATAPFVSMLHQDDYWLPGRCAAVRDWIAARPEAIMHIHAARFVDAKGLRLGKWTCPLPGDGRALDRDTLLERLLVQNFIAVPTPIISRDAFLSAGGIDEALWYTGDWDLYLKLARAGPVIYHDAALACFRVHNESMTVSGSRDARAFDEQMRIVLERHLGLLGHASPSLRARARTSIQVNTCLAAAGHGEPWAAARALSAILALGPFGAFAYLRDSRLIERCLPRLRLRLSGGL